MQANGYKFPHAEHDLMPGDVEKLEAIFAGFEGRMSAEIGNLKHEVRNVRQSIEALVTRREVEGIHEQRVQAHEEVERRIAKIEETLAWAMRLIVMAWLAGLGIGFKVFGAH